MTADAEMPKGYKLTEVGVIPEDWVLRPVAAIATTVTSGRSCVDSAFGDFPVYGSTGIIGQSVKGDYAGRAILVARVGANAGALNVVDGEYGVTDNTIIVRISDVAHWSYVWRQLDAKRLNSMVFGSGQPLITATQIKNLLIPFPPTKAEQEAITEALSDADALIESLEQLLAKKRQIKQGAMQELLTGKKRLPGFSGEWKVKRLGDHVTFLRHGVNSRAELMAEGSVKYLHYGDIHTAAEVLLDPSTSQMPRLPIDRARALDRLQDGDLVLVDASEDLEGIGKSVEVKGVRGEEVVSGLHTIAARFDKTVLADGFKAYLQFCPTFLGHLRRLAAGTKVYATNRTHIATLEILLPDIEEQTAIAAVLSDMDAELAALESKLAKARSLKQGMMQELLTGRIRLV